MTIHKLSSFNIFLEQISNVQIASDTPTVDEIHVQSIFPYLFCPQWHHQVRHYGYIFLGFGLMN